MRTNILLHLVKLKAKILKQACRDDVKDQPSVQAENIKADDGALFRASIDKIIPLPEQNRFIPTRTPIPTRVRNDVSRPSIADTLSDFPFDNSPEAFLRNGLPRLTLRKLKRGTYAVEDELDLHGNQSDAARIVLQEFLHQATQRKLRCVRVIHGKGMNSVGGDAVLRRLTRNWLTQHPHVLAFCAAATGQGGDGAVLILLKVSA